MSVEPIRDPNYGPRPNQVLVQSFGYLYGPIPLEEATVLLDLRTALPEPTLAESSTGLDPGAIRRVMDMPAARAIVAGLYGLTLSCLTQMNPLGLKVFVAVGSATGRCRSVVVANQVMVALRSAGVGTELEHRDILRPVAPTSGW